MLDIISVNKENIKDAVLMLEYASSLDVTYSSIDTNRVYVTKIKQGSKVYCEGDKAAYKLQDNLNKKGIETRVGCNEAGMWSVYVISIPNVIL